MGPLPTLPPNLGVNLPCMVEWPCTSGVSRGNELMKCKGLALLGKKGVGVAGAGAGAVTLVPKSTLPHWPATRYRIWLQPGSTDTPKGFPPRATTTTDVDTSVVAAALTMVTQTHCPSRASSTLSSTPPNVNWVGPVLKTTISVLLEQGTSWKPDSVISMGTGSLDIMASIPLQNEFTQNLACKVHGTRARTEALAVATGTEMGMGPREIRAVTHTSSASMLENTHCKSTSTNWASGSQP